MLLIEIIKKLKAWQVLVIITGLVVYVVFCSHISYENYKENDEIRARTAAKKVTTIHEEIRSNINSIELD